MLDPTPSGAYRVACDVCPEARFVCANDADAAWAALVADGWRAGEGGAGHVCPQCGARRMASVYLEQYGRVWLLTLLDYTPARGEEALSGICSRWTLESEPFEGLVDPAELQRHDAQLLGRVLLAPEAWRERLARWWREQLDAYKQAAWAAGEDEQR